MESVAIYFAIMFFPIIITVGAVVDYSRANNYKTAIQAALDAAMLTGGRDGTEDWDKIALNTFDTKLLSQYERLPRPTFAMDPSTGNYMGTATGSQPTLVLGIVNISSISVVVRAAAVADGEHSYVLALDHGQPKQSVWRVSNLSGDVSLISSAGQQSALVDGAILEPGNNLRTGHNSRLLLVRGKESIAISSDSVIGIPMDVTKGMSTTIYHWAGSILLSRLRNAMKGILKL
jgi:Flp pilus assembly protein TadG